MNNTISAICYWVRTVYIEDLNGGMHGVAYCPNPDVMVWVARRLAGQEGVPLVGLTECPTDVGAWTQ